MNFVIDENVSHGLVAKLRTSGRKVLSIIETATKGLSDRTVFAVTEKFKAILITRDHHFLNPLRFPPNKTQGIIYIRHGNLSSKEEISLIYQFLNNHSMEFFCRKLVILSKDEIKVR